LPICFRHSFTRHGAEHSRHDQLDFEQPSKEVKPGPHPAAPGFMFQI
jgi:hypothetical protein